MVDVGRQVMAGLVERRRADHAAGRQGIDDMGPLQIGVGIRRMRDLERQPRQRKSGVARSGAEPDDALALVRPVFVEPEARVRDVDLRLRQALRPEAHVMALARTVADRLLEADVLAAAEEIERAEGRGRIGRVEHEGPDHAPCAFGAERVGARPAGGGKGRGELREVAHEREIDRIARQAVAGHRIGRHMLAVEDFEAHAHRIGQHDIGRREIGRAEREDQRQFLIREAEDDEDDQPDGEGAERQNRHTLKKADQVSHAGL